MMEIIDARRGGREALYKKLAARGEGKTESVLEAVSEIVEKVRLEGDAAVLEYTREFDGVALEKGQLRVSREEMDGAYNLVDPKFVEVIRRAKANIEDFHMRQKENSWFTTGNDGIILGLMKRPLESVGVYVPGGTASLISSVLMNVIPAKVAGVGRIVMATPPGKDGSISAAMLVAAGEAGVTEIYRAGGAQAVSAMAFGTDTVKKVDKIVGPGNIYVATAKKLLYGYCGIDMIAGPSEIMVIADETANPVYVAADLLSQAEHDVMASAILVTTSADLAGKVVSEVERQMGMLERGDIMRKSIDAYGTAVIVNDMDEALETTNAVAPEHLELCVADPFSLLGSVRNAGAVFLGSFAPEPLGDYLAGPNHVLPTSGTARFFSPLNVGDFIKKTSIISYTGKALREVGGDVIRFAEAEGLTAHANAVRVRLDG